MSVNLATMGMFKDCCGGMAIGGGGAPPYSQNATERVKPHILVKKLEMKTKNNIEDYLKKIKVKLVDTD
jgi:hypothetical protein